MLHGLCCLQGGCWPAGTVMLPFTVTAVLRHSLIRAVHPLPASVLQGKAGLALLACKPCGAHFLATSCFPTRSCMYARVVSWSLLVCNAGKAAQVLTQQAVAVQLTSASLVTSFQALTISSI